MQRLSLGVVGAGIGGLVAALSLARRGHAVTIIERRGGFTEVGAGLQLSPNASRVLIEMGLQAPLRRVACEPRRVLIRSIATGQPIGEAAQGSYMRERFGAPAWVLRRVDLQTILLDAVRSLPSIRILMGRAVEGVDGGDEAVTLAMVRSNSQPEAATFDALIGADGIWSSTRGALGAKTKPRYRGYGAWRATVARQQVPPEIAENETGLWLGREGHVVHYPVAGGREINIVAVDRRAEPVEGWSAQGYPEELQARFGRAAPLLKGLLRSPHDWQLWSLFDMPAHRMAAGRIALIGDAAHPVLPFLAQGAALAIEDAAVLSESLSGSRPVGAALALYEAARLKRAKRVQRAARLNGLVYHAGPLVSLVRDRVMAHLGPAGMTERYAWLYGYRSTLAPEGGSR